MKLIFQHSEIEKMAALIVQWVTIAFGLQTIYIWLPTRQSSAILSGRSAIQQSAIENRAELIVQWDTASNAFDQDTWVN